MVDDLNLTKSAFTPVVAVPVRDEAERLPKLLTALSDQSWITLSGQSLPVVLVFNNCRDGSAAVVRSMAYALPELRLIRVQEEFAAEQAHAGSARRAAMNAAQAEGGPNAVLISTDADAVPASDWVHNNLNAISQGADLVGGRIIGDPDEENLLGSGFLRRAARQHHYKRLVDQLTAMMDPTPYDPWPRHNDHTGASLAVRSQVYAQLGGIPAIPSGEDVAFVRRGIRAGFRLRHAPEVWVQVSARLDGRAKGGMADCIRGWVEAEQFGLPHLVEDPCFVLRRLTLNSRAIRLRAGDGDHAAPNVRAACGVKGPEIDVDTAINRLERMIALNGLH